MLSLNFQSLFWYSTRFHLHRWHTSLLCRLLRGRFKEWRLVCTARNDASSPQVRHCEPRNHLLERD